MTAHRLHGSHGRLRGQGGIVERGHPVLLVVPLDDRIVLGHEEADARVGIRLRVGGVADHLVGRPLPGRGTPVARLGWHRRPGRAQPRRSNGVLLDIGVPLGVREAGRRRAHRRSRRARPPPLVLIGLDLGRVGLEMLDVDAQPLLCRVAPGLGVGARTLPRGLRQPPDQRVRVRAQRLHDRQGRLGGQRVVVDGLCPAVLVEGVDRRVHLGHEEADPRVAVGLGIRAVAENFVGRPRPRARAPGARRRREVAPRRGDLVRPGGEAVEQNAAIR